MTTEAYPLQWPAGWKRNRNPKRSRFGSWNTKPSIAQSTNIILDELGKLTGSSRDIIISTNLKLKNDGLPYSNQKEPADKGVAVYFMMDKKQMVIACDSFDKIGCNLYAIGKTIEAMRGIERWGCSELLHRAFTGFQALPSGPTQRGWWEILGCSEGDSLSVIKSNYYSLAKRHHPDTGGDVGKFQELQFAYEQALKEKQ